jgi:hypothetical protein
MTKVDGAAGWLRERLTGWAGPVLVAGATYIGTRSIIEAAGRLHWMAGLLATLVFSLMVYGFLRALIEAIKNLEPMPIIAGLFLMALLTATVVCAWISFALHAYLHAPFQSARELNPTTFCDLYVWHFIDMIPVVDAWKTLHVEKPIESLSPLAAAPEFAFRALVAVPLLAAAKVWWERRS